MIKAVKEELKQDLIDLIRNHEGLSVQRRAKILASLQHPDTQVDRSQLDLFFKEGQIPADKQFFEKHMTKNQGAFTLAKRKETPTVSDPNKRPTKKHK